MNTSANTLENTPEGYAALRHPRPLISVGQWDGKLNDNGWQDAPILHFLLLFLYRDIPSSPERGGDDYLMVGNAFVLHPRTVVATEDTRLTRVKDLTSSHEVGLQSSFKRWCSRVSGGWMII